MTSNSATPPMARPRMAAGAAFVNERDQVLVVRPSYKPTWDIPGGYVEPGESPLDACVREVREELGISPPIGRLLVVDWAPIDTEGDKMLFVFDGGQLDADTLAGITLDQTELTDYAFLGADQLPEVMAPRLSRRITAAFDARRGASTFYLEHGRERAAVSANSAPAAR